MKLCLIIPCALLSATLLGNPLDLKQAVVVSPPGFSGPEAKAVLMLIDEVEKRTGIRWPSLNAWPAPNVPVVAVGPQAALNAFAGPYLEPLRALGDFPGSEGYRLRVQASATNAVVFVVGNDARGVLFGVGRLLRELQMEPGRLSISDDVRVQTAPKYPLRGHQLGYRPKCNSYDAWDLPVWEQYFRDLAVFGCNAIELIPPRSDDDADSPHFPRPPMEMMIGMSRLAKDYGLDVWIWYPAMDKDYSDPATVDLALQEWAAVFKQLPRIDAVFVPGGDPGHTEPKRLMRLLEQQTQNLHRYHPKAQMWVSPQSFNQAWLDQFLQILTRDQPAWLSGIVFGPQVRIALPKLRQLVPAHYPIRHYPDITHSRQCQYPVPDWDVAYAVTEARECINPRPVDEAAIFRKTQPFTAGFITYSEGCNDDVNKMVWSALGWDPEAKIGDTLREFGNYFIGPAQAESFALGLLALEQDWRGALMTNATVESTLARFQAMEKAAQPRLLRNWRFQQALFRAYYDAYVRHRLIYEAGLEDAAMNFLRQAPAIGSSNALLAADAVLGRAVTNRIDPDLRLRVFELGDALFQSIGMQLSVEKYRAIAVDRGASLDTIDYPLNNRPWLSEQFGRIRKLLTESERLASIATVVNWTNPGPGDFYDDLGRLGKRSHLVRGLSFGEDPGSMSSSRIGFEEDLVVDEPDEKSGEARRLSWISHAETLYDTPLEMRYTGLDPRADYRIRIVYAGDSPKRKIRLAAAGDVEVHPLMAKPFPFKPIEFDLPRRATEHGELTLTWSGEPGLGGNGRGCQVSEVWLLKK